MPKKKIEQHSVPIEETIAKGDETALKKTEIDEVSSQEVKEEVLKEEAEVLEVKEVPKKKSKKRKKAKKQSDSPSTFVRFFKNITVKQWISFAIIIVVYVLLAIFTSQNMYELIRLTLFSAVPLALVAMGGLYSERSCCKYCFRRDYDVWSFCRYFNTRKNPKYRSRWPMGYLYCSSNWWDCWSYL